MLCAKCRLHLAFYAGDYRCCLPFFCVFFDSTEDRYLVLVQKMSIFENAVVLHIINSSFLSHEYKKIGQHKNNYDWLRNCNSVTVIRHPLKEIFPVYPSPLYLFFHIHCTMHLFLNHCIILSTGFTGHNLT